METSELFQFRLQSMFRIYGWSKECHYTWSIDSGDSSRFNLSITGLDRTMDTVPLLFTSPIDCLDSVLSKLLPFEHFWNPRHDFIDSTTDNFKWQHLFHRIRNSAESVIVGCFIENHQVDQMEELLCSIQHQTFPLHPQIVTEIFLLPSVNNLDRYPFNIGKDTLGFHFHTQVTTSSQLSQCKCWKLLPHSNDIYKH